MIFFKNQNDIVCSTQQIQITRDLPNYHKHFKIFKEKRQSSILLLLKTKYNFPPKNNDIPRPPSKSPPPLSQKFIVYKCAPYVVFW